MLGGGHKQFTFMQVVDIGKSVVTVHTVLVPDGVLREDLGNVVREILEAADENVHAIQGLDEHALVQHHFRTAVLSARGYIHHDTAVRGNAERSAPPGERKGYGPARCRGGKDVHTQGLSAESVLHKAHPEARSAGG